MNGRNTNPCLRNTTDCTHSLHSPYYIMITSYYITLSKNRTSSKPGLTSRANTTVARDLVPRERKQRQKTRNRITNWNNVC